MNLRDAIKDLKNFVRLKTTQQPAFVSVILEALERIDHCGVYHGGELRLWMNEGKMDVVPEYSCEVFFETEEAQAEFEYEMQNLNRYRWHDLRKDPEDLPGQEGMVLVSLNGKLGSVRYVHAVESRYYSPGDEPFYGDPYMNGLVEAWKEIEPFEEVE